MIQDVKIYLKDRQWEFQEIDDKTIASGFSSPLPNTDQHSFPLFFMIVDDQLHEDYLRLAIVPYIDKPDDGFASSIAEIICHINHNMPVAKFSVDDEGDLELLIDIPRDEFTYKSLNSAIQLLADYATIYLSDLLEMIWKKSSGA